MAARKRSNATRNATWNAATSSASSLLGNNNSNNNNNNNNNDDNNDAVIRLYVGNILGRRPSKPPPVNSVTPVRHVDIGLVDCHIPRKLLQVSRADVNSLELDVFLDPTIQNKEEAAKAHRKCARLAASICKVVRRGRVIEQTEEEGAADNTIVLQHHDIFVVAKTCKGCEFEYQFQVLPVAQETTSISPTHSTMASSPSSSLAEEEVEVVVVEAEQQQQQQQRQESSSRNEPEQASSSSSAKVESELDTLEKKLGFRPHRPTRPMGSARSNAVAATSAKKRRKSPKPLKQNDAKDSNDASDDSDESEDEVEVNRKVSKQATMHATLANTYYKALGTSTPHFGSSLLHQLLASKGDLPTPNLLEDLVKLLTFGPTYHEDYAFMEGNRLQLALDYVQKLLQQHPQEMGPRFLQAASKVAGDVDYWRLSLDQLLILPYPQTASTNNDNNTSTSNHTTNPEIAKQKQLLQSLELHAVSLKFLLILLQQQQQQDQHDTKTVTRHVAQIMAQVWVTRGHYYVLSWRHKDPALLLVVNAVEQVTRQLTQVLGCVTHFGKTAAAAALKEQEVVDMLWSAMDERFRQANVDNDDDNDDGDDTKNCSNAKDKKKILLTWILQLEDLIPTHSKWGTVTDGLVKRARLRKEYNVIATKVE
ncbi:MAG: hypothetical protein SGBAC_013566 [Bacillariaceae sp.]